MLALLHEIEQRRRNLFRSSAISCAQAWNQASNRPVPRSRPVTERPSKSSRPPPSIPTVPLGQITASHIDETFNTNVKGTIFTVQKALPLMKPGGSIILTGSSAGATGAPGFSAYGASKAAVRNLAQSFSLDLKGTGIRINVLSPGPTATELAKAALGEDGQKAYGMMTPLQRMADRAELGAVAAFLASDDSSFMTASEVAVDGGLAQV